MPTEQCWRRKAGGRYPADSQETLHPALLKDTVTAPAGCARQYPAPMSTMEIKSVLPCQSLFVVSTLVCGALATFGQSQEVSPPVITQVEVNRPDQKIDQKTIVRVTGSGALTCRTMRLNDPERLVLDFPGARLAGLRPSIPAAFPPIRRVRTGQFRPDIARVVVDLERVAAYRVRSEGNSVMVEFDVEASASARSASVPAPAVGVLHTALARPAKTTPSNPTVVVGTRSPFRSDPPFRPVAPLTGGPPSENQAMPFEGNFKYGMLTFRARNQSLRSVLKRIGDEAGVSIYLTEGLGNDQISVEFQGYRLDEALRQILSHYDVFFLYGEEQGTLASPPLRAVWVYPAGRVEAGSPLPESTVITGKKAAPMQTGANAGPYIEAPTRPKGNDPVTVVSQALENRSDGVRLKLRGALKGHESERLTGVAGVVFSIYEQQEGGVPLWQEVQNVQLDEQGHFAVLVGSTTNGGIPPKLFAAEKVRWLGKQVLLPGEVEQPRVRLISTPHGLMVEGDVRLLIPAESGDQRTTAETDESIGPQQDASQPVNKPSRAWRRLLRLRMR